MPHLAQLNIGTLRYPIDHLNTQEFVDNIDHINHLAERSPGFVWRLKDEAGNATSFQIFPDPMTIVNMSVWENADILKEYVYRSGHVEVMRKRYEWLEKHDKPFMVLWWIPEGHLPTLAEAKQRIELLDKNGETAEAFTFRKMFDPPQLA